MIYLDNAATTFPKPEMVYEAVLNNMKNYGANPGRSGHKLALEAGRVIFKGREMVCRLFNIDDPMQVIFTCNATEALNLAIKGVLEEGDHVITTSMEHNSVMRPIKSLENNGVENTVIQCDEAGGLNPRLIERAIKENTKLIVVTHASNVTGTIMPIEEIGEIAKRKNVLFLVDAAQTAGVYDIDVKNMNIDLLATAGHKGLMGPQGTGILFIGEGVEVKHFKEGGTGSKSQELTQPLMLPDRYESGTPNTPGIAGLTAGIEFILKEGLDKIRKHEEEITSCFLEGVKNIPGIIIYGKQDATKQAAVVSINIGEEDSSEIGYVLDKVFDVGIRPGLHCAPMAHKTIGTLEQGTVRFSFGYFTTKEEVKIAIEAIRNIKEEVI
ncbi:cysteine desulfurase family protein [Natronincola peptidivorans]|uniref:cysteine desulfurase n=1 Tax=Natronincola peptidivorans TaxID=426128 RepID=A0A1I0GLA5_9FIRM|nr:aminotransferase class V-fold PLP-dependent enzyme [Natronincola peptidivorans]SET71997.1 cysteine desulfurase family protein [Natronincola peptidivorans]